MAFNLLGVIEATSSPSSSSALTTTSAGVGAENQIITIEFHNKSHASRRGWHFTDSWGYEMASLGPRGALFACGPSSSSSSGDGEGSGRESQLGRIYYRPYESWGVGGGGGDGNGAEWSVGLRRGERPVAIAAGGAPLRSSSSSSSDEDLDEDGQDSQTRELKEMRRGPKDAGGAGYVVVALNNGDVHFWLGTGVHVYVWRAGGEVVSVVCGGGSDGGVGRGAGGGDGGEWCCVVWREGGTSLDGAFPSFLLILPPLFFEYAVH